MLCVILCGGLGTRLGHHAGDLPKPLARVGGVSVLEHLIALARAAGLREVVLVTGHRAGMIEDHLGDGSRFGVALSYAREPRPMGTAGGVKAIEDRIDGDFLLLYGDVLMCFDVGRLARFHEARGAMATLVVHPNDHPSDSDLIELGASGRVVAFHTRPRPPGRSFFNLVNAGAYLLSPEILRQIRPGEPLDFGRDVFPRLVGSGRLFGYNTTEYFKDMGTPDRFQEVCDDWSSGRIERMHRRHPRPALFLPRDGVLCRDTGDPDLVELLPGVVEAVRRINRSDHLAVLVDDPPAPRTGWPPSRPPSEARRRLETLLGAGRARLDVIVSRPRRRESARRMVHRLAGTFPIDLAGSILIGSAGIDLEFAADAGIAAVGLRTGGFDRDSLLAPDLAFEDLAEAVETLVGDGPSASRPGPPSGIGVPAMATWEA